MTAHRRCLLWGAIGKKWNKNVSGGVHNDTMTRRDVFLRHLYHDAGNKSVQVAHEQFNELMSMPIPDALNAAQDLKDSEIFIEALITGQGSQQAALDRLRSHFYIREVITLNQILNRAKRLARSLFIGRIYLFNSPLNIANLSRGAFKNVSRAIEPQSLSVEMDLLLTTIRAAHAPTAAIERSSLQAVSI